MLYQTMMSLSVAALALLWRHNFRASNPADRYTYLVFHVCATVYLLSGFYPDGASSYALMVQGIEILSFVMMFPLMFINIKRFTNLSLPQWRAIRAFSLGAPLLVGIDGAVNNISTADNTVVFSAYMYVAYCYGIFAALVALWRFVSTPRQRGSTALLILGPATIVVADIGYRLVGWQIWNDNASLAMTLICISIFALLVIRNDQFNVFSVARSALIDQVRDMLLVISQNQDVVDCNRSAADWLDATERTLIGTPVQRWLPDDLCIALAADPNLQIELPWSRSGTEFWFEVLAVPLIVDKRANGVLVTLRDISDRRRAEAMLVESRRQLELANTRLSVQANTDELTGLYNRRYFMAHLSAEIERHSRSGLTLGLLMLDLDHFKLVNDGYGHPAGDLVLQQAASCMRHTVRESDIVCRVGGEEFAVIAVDAKVEGPVILAERLRANLAGLAIEASGQRVSISASIGCVYSTGGMIDADTLVKLADQMLYRSKSAGRNRVTSQVLSTLLGRSRHEVTLGLSSVASQV